MGIAARVLAPERKFSPADPSVNWQRIETLVHGPGTSGGSTEGDLNSAVFACLQVISIAYTEPPLRTYRRQSDGSLHPLANQPVQDVLNRPTQYGELTMSDILGWSQWVKHITGNAYFRKVRGGQGNVVEIWPISPRLLRPVTIKGSGDWISYWEYNYEPGKFERVDPADIIHLRMGIDDRDHRLGMSPLRRLLRSISTDTEADKFTDALLMNYAVPGLVVTTKDKHLTFDESQQIKDGLRRNFGSDNRGNIALLNNEAEVKQFGFSPRDLDLISLHKHPETRIAAVLDVPPILANLGSGLDAMTYSNFEQARKKFTQTKMVAHWRNDQEALTNQLMPDFTADRSVLLAFDLSNVAALQEDENEKYERLSLVVDKILTVNEAREDLGYPPLPGHDELKDPLAAFGQPGDDDAEDEGTKGRQTKLNRRILRAFPDILQAMNESARPALEEDISAYLDGQRRRLRERMLAGSGV